MEELAAEEAASDGISVEQIPCDSETGAWAEGDTARSTAGDEMAQEVECAPSANDLSHRWREWSFRQRPARKPAVEALPAPPAVPGGATKVVPAEEATSNAEVQESCAKPGESVPCTDTALLRSGPDFAVIYHFLQLFGSTLHFPTRSMENIEQALIHGDALLLMLLGRLLGTKLPTGDPVEKWGHLQKCSGARRFRQFLRDEEDAGAVTAYSNVLFGPDPANHYREHPASLRARLVRRLCEWKLEDSEELQRFVNDRRRRQANGGADWLRLDPYAQLGPRILLWCLAEQGNTGGACFLFQESLLPPPRRKRKPPAPGAARGRGKRSGCAGKVVGGGLDGSGPVQLPSEPKWETLATTADEMEGFVERLRAEKRYELAEKITQELLLPMQRRAKREARMMHYGIYADNILGVRRSRRTTQRVDYSYGFRRHGRWSGESSSDEDQERSSRRRRGSPESSEDEETKAKRIAEEASAQRARRAERAARREADAEAERRRQEELEAERLSQKEREASAREKRRVRRLWARDAIREYEDTAEDVEQGPEVTEGSESPGEKGAADALPPVMTPVSEWSSDDLSGDASFPRPPMRQVVWKDDDLDDDSSDTPSASGDSDWGPGGRGKRHGKRKRKRRRHANQESRHAQLDPVQPEKRERLIVRIRNPRLFEKNESHVEESTATASGAPDDKEDPAGTCEAELPSDATSDAGVQLCKAPAGSWTTSISVIPDRREVSVSFAESETETVRVQRSHPSFDGTTIGVARVTPEMRGGDVENVNPPIAHEATSSGSSLFLRGDQASDV